MPSALLSIAIISLAIWLYLAAARGNFWNLRAFNDDTANHQSLSAWPPVVAVVPARNEATTIAQSLRSLLQQNYPGEFSVILVDDHSEDATAAQAREAASALNTQSQLTILTAPALPPGWTGKLWALQSGTAILGSAPAASSSREPLTTSRTSSKTPTSPAYYWFTDADIHHAPETLQHLVSRAEHENFDLASLMVLLQAKSFPERLLIPPFLFFFLKLYPPSWIANPSKQTAGAAGGCILLRREALERIGGFAAIRSEVIDDCALARAVKVAQPFLAVLRGPQSIHEQSSPPDRQTMVDAAAFPAHNPQPSPGKIWMGLTRASVSLRAYTSFGEICDLIARTAFTQLHYSASLLLATLLAMFLTYIAPAALLLAPGIATRILAATTWLLMSLLYLPTIRFYRQSPAWAVTLPLAALFYSYATTLSAIRYYAGRGAQWKGRNQAS